MTEPGAGVTAPGWRRLVVALVLWFGFGAHGYVENTDALATLHAARALYERGDPGLLGSAPDATELERTVCARARAAVDAGQHPSYGMFGRDGAFYVWFPIGHQLLLLLPVALGDACEALFPGPAARYRDAKGPLFGELFWAQWWASFVPVLFGAGSVWCLWWIAFALSRDAQRALWVALAASLCTQMWPGSSETTSDAPGQFFLLATAAAVLRIRAGLAGRWTPYQAGFCAGWAVLIRYPHAVPVAVLLGLLCVHARRTGCWRPVLGVVLAGLPEALLLLAANVLRFDSLFETGYSSGANAEFWSYPAYLGVPAVLFAPGKGILWFSPPLWLALAALARRGIAADLRAATWLLLVLPIAIIGHTASWAAGQCWGIRYATPSVVLAVAIALAAAPVRRPRIVAVVCLLGLVVSLGGVLTPYRGQQQLAYTAAAVVYPGAEQVDNNVNADPRFSPLHTHWIYAGLSATGRLERGGSENTTEPLFGVRVPGPVALAHPDQDAGFRHFFWIGLGLPAWVTWAGVVGWALAVAGLVRSGLRRVQAAGSDRR